MSFRPSLMILAVLACLLAAAPRSQLAQHLSGIDWRRYEDETVTLMQQYLRIDTSNPPGNELGAAELFHRIFEQAGIPSTIYPYAPGRADICAAIKGDGSLRPLVFLNHMDVVRAEAEDWTVPPFAGEIRNGLIYGRGALDMKDEGLLQAMVMVVAAREHLRLKRDLIFLATADEEVGGTGSLWILKNHPELLRNAEYLITEGGTNLILPGQGTLYQVGVAEKAPFWLRLTATGRGGHGSIPVTDSAPNRLVRALGRVVDWQPPFRLLPCVEQYFREISPFETKGRAAQFRNLRKAIRNPNFVRQLRQEQTFNYLLQDTISLTVLKGSPQTNVIPDVAYAELDVRLLPGEDPQVFLAQLRKVIADDTIRLETLSRFKPPNSSSADTGLFHLIEQVVHEYNPHALVAPGLNSGYTESQMFRPLGISCYGFNSVEVSAELDATQHAADERVPVDQLRHGLKMLYDLVARAANE